MSTPKATGGPAFPRPIGQAQDGVGGHWSDSQQGMTLRDWFAGQALAGICANGDWGHHPTTPNGSFGESMAAWAYEYADAMLIARAKA